MSGYGARNWTDYWAQTSAGTACLPQAPEGLNRTIEDFWRHWANSIPINGQIADLCCGNGAVLRALAQWRSDLRLTGYDYAHVPSNGSAWQIHGSIDCADLPLSDGSVDAVCSQFGLEYADELAWKEAGRIAAPEASMALVVHHKDGLLVRSNMRRLAALTAFLDSGLLDRGLAAASGRTVDDVDDIMHALAQNHAGQSIISELFRVIQQALQMGHHAKNVIEKIAAKAISEQGRLIAMGQAAKDRSKIGEMANILAQGRQIKIEELIAANHGVIAWSVELHR